MKNTSPKEKMADKSDEEDQDMGGHHGKFAAMSFCRQSILEFSHMMSKQKRY